MGGIRVLSARNLYLNQFGDHLDIEWLARYSRNNLDIHRLVRRWQQIGWSCTQRPDLYVSQFGRDPIAGFECPNGGMVYRCFIRRWNQIGGRCGWTHLD